ncbi:MAG: HAD-IA family hydrolase [Solirubrobacterales bacterium]
MNTEDRGVRVVISDFGGVMTNPLMDSFIAYERQTGIPLEVLGAAMDAIMDRDGEHPLFELEKGLLSEADFTRMMQDELGARLEREIEFHTFPDTYFEHLHPNQRYLDFLFEYKATGGRLALLTNNVREWEHRWRGMLPIDELFETVVDSGFVGTRKPERRIYEITHERIVKLDGLGDIEPRHCVLVDDIAVNCEAAREFGFLAVQFVETEQAIAETRAILAGG